MEDKFPVSSLTVDEIVLEAPSNHQINTKNAKLISTMYKLGPIPQYAYEYKIGDNEMYLAKYICVVG
jgi:hypothetical protein